VWPREIEDAIASHPAVVEVAATGIPHAGQGEAVKAWVVIWPGHTITAGEIINWCKERLAYYKIPHEVEFRQTLPRTSVGKLLRRELVREHVETTQK